MFRSLLTVGLLFFAGLESVSAQMLIENFTDATNNRFTDNANFIGAGFDFSGVARTTNNGRWGTLISSNAALTARHFPPSVGSTFEFYPGNDPTATPSIAIVTSIVRVGNTDLSIAILDRNVDSRIAVYDFATEEYVGDAPVTITNPDGTTATQTFFNTNPRLVDIVGDRALMVGVSQSTNPSTSTDQAVGENLVFAYSENVVFGSNSDNDSIILERDAVGSANALTHESYVRGGDSGGPTFLIGSATNELVLIGVNSYQLNGGSFQSSGSTYTGNQVEEINVILAANFIEPVLLGDCNLDGVVDFLDVSPFINILLTDDYLEQADIDGNGEVDFLDISPFIAVLVN